VRWLAQEPVADAPPAVPAAYAAPAGARGAPAADSAPAYAAEAPIGGDRAGWPTDLAAFHAWWLEHPALDDGQVRGRVAPRGPAGAGLMIVVPEPEPEDEEHLLSGRGGSLLRAILAAIGSGPEEVYVASALPRATPGADWAAFHARGLGELLAHHIGLVGPKRLILFGPHILPLLGHNPAQIAQTSLSFNHEGRTIPLMGSQDLQVLVDKPARKAALWQRWLAFSGSKLDGTAQA